MAKPKTVYSCTECGGQTLKWQGQCPHCQAWNTLVEALVEGGKAGAHRFASIGGASEVVTLAHVEAEELPRLPTAIGEFDRVLGGGVVDGGAVLNAAGPGLRQTTLIL